MAAVDFQHHENPPTRNESNQHLLDTGRWLYLGERELELVRKKAEECRLEREHELELARIEDGKQRTRLLCSTSSWQRWERIREARHKEEMEARLKAEEETRLKAEEETRLKAGEQARLKIEGKWLVEERCDMFKRNVK
ncbi:hypothetical protein TNCV_1847421 [Trichonephila clavipes]|nr:hypothetical protein TNCV_1847421 [Trichonephila clavipes]